MTKKKGPLQTFSLVSAVVSFILAFIAGVLLYFQPESVGSGNPVSASLMSSIFFFIFVGVVLTVIGKADIPSFKFDDAKED